jgi:hypothetical protein
MLFEISIVFTPHDDFCSVIVATLVLDGTPARCFVAYAVSHSRLLFCIHQCESRLSRCLHLRRAEGGQKAQVSIIKHLSHVQVRFYLLRTVCASIRIPGTQPESTNAPDLREINDSNLANNPDPNVLIGLDALLQVLQSANASSVVSTPPPDSFDFSRSSAHVSENAVQVAATALNQLSQQEAPDTHHPFAGMILSVCVPSPDVIYFSLDNLLRFDSSAALGTQRHHSNTNATFPIRRSQHSCSPTTSTDLRFTGYFPLSIGHVLRITIARVHRVNCRQLSSSSPCWPLLARQHCSSYQKRTMTYVPTLIFT